MAKAQRKKIIKEMLTGTQVGMILEDVRDDFKVIAEQHTDIIKKINGLEDRVESLDSKFNSFIIETRANFKAVFDYLSRIEGDFLSLKKQIEKIEKEKVDYADFNWLKNKVLEIEKKLEDYKKQQTALAAKL